MKNIKFQKINEYTQVVWLDSYQYKILDCFLFAKS